MVLSSSVAMTRCEPPLGSGEEGKSPAGTCRAARLGEWIGACASTLRILGKLTGTMVQPEIDDATVGRNYRKRSGPGQRNVNGRGPVPPIRAGHRLPSGRAPRPVPAAGKGLGKSRAW